MNPGKRNIILGTAITLVVALLVYFLASKYETPADTQAVNENNSSDLIQTIDEINQLLDSVRTQHGLLGAASSVEASSKRNRIIQTIKALSALIGKNEEKLRNKNELYVAASKENSTLRQKLMAYENSRLDIVKEIQDLKYELELAEKENVRLNNSLKHEKKKFDRISKKLSNTEDIAYTAYYIWGDHQRLKKLNLLENTGNDLPINEFEKVDVRAEAIIPTHSKSVKLVTRHANSSYNWQEDDQGNLNLCIVDPLLFWKNSRYLVIEVK